MTERNNREVGACIIVDNKDRVLVLMRGSTDPWKPGLVGFTRRTLRWRRTPGRRCRKRST